MKNPKLIGAFRQPSLRRRLTLVFAGAVVFTALALSLSAYLLTARALEQDAVEKAITQTWFNLFLADSTLPASPEPADFERLLEALAIRGDFGSLLLAGGDTFVSGPEVSPELVSPDLAAKVAEGRLAYQTVRVGDIPTLVTGGRLREGRLAAYFFFPQDARLATLARLRTVLIVTAVVMTVLGLLAGYAFSRGLLRPVREASRAALRVARGDLDTRLPEGPDEFGVLNATFNRMAANLKTRIGELEESRNRERRFVDDAAHELRTPVAALCAEIELLTARLGAAQTGLPPDLVRLTSLLAADIGRLHRLVDDLLEIGRLDARAVEASLERVQLEEFLVQLLRTYGWTAVVELAPNPRADEGGRPVSVLADKRLLERIMVNLLQNALQHGAPPVTINVTASEDTPGHRSGVACVTVTDSGPGIPVEQIPFLFDRFFKGDPSRSSRPGAYGGSGLGLSIARGYARLLGGDLELASPQRTATAAAMAATPDPTAPSGPSPPPAGSGATFVLTLPRVDSAESDW